MDIKYCTQCGEKVSCIIPSNDTFQRHICNKCGFIHYQNPKIVVGCIAYKGDEILLCKRSIEPRSGLWTVPAGFLENGENTRNGAQRETLEEACAEVKINNLFFVANLTKSNQIYMLYLAEIKNINFIPNIESSEVCFFSENEIPWDTIAFHSVKIAISNFYADLKNRKFLLHEVDF